MGQAVSIVIPVCNQLGYTRIAMDYLLNNTVNPFNLVIIDNGSKDGTKAFFEELSGRINVTYVRNDTNLGPILALNQGIKATDSNIICTMHNDLILFEKGWLGKLVSLIETEPSLGLIGLAGRRGMDKRGVVDEKSLVHNLQNEGLCPRMKDLWQEVVVLDGVFIAGRREVFEKVGGFDEVYGLMHFYDMDISLRSRAAGYKNAVINIEALHIYNGGITRKTEQYKKQVPNDLKLMNTNSRIFFKKWRNSFPMTV